MSAFDTGEDSKVYPQSFGKSSGMGSRDSTQRIQSTASRDSVRHRDDKSSRDSTAGDGNHADK